MNIQLYQGLELMPKQSSKRTQLLSNRREQGRQVPNVKDLSRKLLHGAPRWSGLAIPDSYGPYSPRNKNNVIHSTLKIWRPFGPLFLLVSPTYKHVAVLPLIGERTPAFNHSRPINAISGTGLPSRAFLPLLAHFLSNEGLLSRDSHHWLASP